MIINLKKKSIVKHELINIFLSKEAKTNQMDDLDDIEIVLKGIAKTNMDSSRYYIRFTFKDGTRYSFGECLSFRKISYKVNDFNFFTSLKNI